MRGKITLDRRKNSYNINGFPIVFYFFKDSKTNLIMFDELELQRQKKLELQKRFNEINDQNFKLAKRKNGLFYGIGGTALGILVGVLITK